MPQSLLIIVAGPPGSGKTTLARRLALDLDLPLVGRDDIKELLFDSLGWSDRAWSQQIGRASYHLLYYVTELLLAGRASLIVESNFSPAVATAEFLALKQQYDCRTFVIHCRADAATLYRRFQHRATAGQRHPGHGDLANHEEFRQALDRGDDDLLDLGGPLLVLDTTDFDAIDYPALLGELRTALLLAE